MFDRAACLGDPHGGLTACRYYGAHSLEDVSCGRVGCWLVRRPSIECFCFWCREELPQPEIQGAARATQLPTSTQPSGRRQAVKSIRSAGAKYPTPVFEWQQPREETRQMVTGLMVHLLVNHQRRDREPSSTGRRGDVDKIKSAPSGTQSDSRCAAIFDLPGSAQPREPGAAVCRAGPPRGARLVGGRTVDDDLGRSAAGGVTRVGFERMVAEGSDRSCQRRSEDQVVPGGKLAADVLGFFMPEK